MRKYGEKREKGAVEVEATIILPIAILSVVLLLYLSLFLFQRANLQACLETAVVYYKNTLTDTYVTHNEKVEYEQDTHMGEGNSYSATQPLDPYRGLFGDGNHLNSKEAEAAFKRYFNSIARGMLFNSEDINVTLDYTNYVVLKQIEVTATQKIEFPMELGILGIGTDYEISATARVAVIDHDSTIRDVDYAIDLLEDTKLGEMAGELASKVGEAYGKFKDFFGVE